MKMTNRSRYGTAALVAAGALLLVVAVAYASGGGEAHHGASITPEKIKDLIYRILNFAALVVLLLYFLKKPIANGLANRRETIRAELEQLEARKAEAERTYRECEAKLAGLDSEAERIIAEAVKMGESEKARIISEAERAAGDIKRQAEMAVQHELAVAKSRLRAEVAEEAARVAEEIIRKNLQPADQSRMIEQYLEKVGGVQ